MSLCCLILGARDGGYPGEDGAQGEGQHACPPPTSLWSVSMQVAAAVAAAVAGGGSGGYTSI